MNNIEHIALVGALLALSKNTYFIGLTVIIGFDYLTGVLKAAYWNVADSSVGLKGLIKHTLVIVSMAAVWVLCSGLRSEAVGVIVTMMYGSNYIISILENFAVMGIYAPKFLSLRVKAEQKRYEKKLADLIGVEKEDNNNDESGTSQAMD